jgi:esterase/lipase
LLQGPIDIRCPVRILHGKQDDAVDWRKSEKILSLLASADKSVTWVEDGDHRLSRPEDLEKIDALVLELSRLCARHTA